MTFFSMFVIILSYPDSGQGEEVAISFLVHLHTCLYVLWCASVSAYMRACACAGMYAWVFLCVPHTKPVYHL